jgi:hypothetical protein
MVPVPVSVDLTAGVGSKNTDAQDGRMGDWYKNPLILPILF